MSQKDVSYSILNYHSFRRGKIVQRNPTSHSFVSKTSITSSPMSPCLVLQMPRKLNPTFWSCVVPKATSNLDPTFPPFVPETAKHLYSTSPPSEPPILTLNPESPAFIFKTFSRPSSSNAVSPVKAKYDPTTPEFVPRTPPFGLNPESPFLSVNNAQVEFRIMVLRTDCIRHLYFLFQGLFA